MKAVIFKQFGDPQNVLQVEDQPLPSPNRGELRVRMIASPVNPSDIMTIQGEYSQLPTLPATPGYEGVGIVEQAGGGLYSKYLVGKRVTVLNRERGNWCEQTIVPSKQVIPVPSQISDEQAALFFVNPATAFVMTQKVLRVSAGDWLLQTAAGSALGRMVIRLGKHFGFRTINVVRRPEQVEELKALGADVVLCFDGSQQSPNELKEEVEKATAGKGVRYAIDPVGGATGAATVTCLADGGRMLSFGSLSGQPMEISSRDLITNVATVEGFGLAQYMQQQRLLGKLRLVKTIGRLIQQRILDSEVRAAFELDQYTDAMKEAMKPGQSGKVLLRMTSAG